MNWAWHAYLGALAGVVVGVQCWTWRRVPLRTLPRWLVVVNLAAFALNASFLVRHVLALVRVP